MIFQSTHSATKVSNFGHCTATLPLGKWREHHAFCYISIYSHDLWRIFPTKKYFNAEYYSENNLLHLL
jgi:hypothetical protein